MRGLKQETVRKSKNTGVSASGDDKKVIKELNKKLVDSEGFQWVINIGFL